MTILEWINSNNLNGCSRLEKQDDKKVTDHTVLPKFIVLTKAAIELKDKVNKICMDQLQVTGQILNLGTGLGAGDDTEGIPIQIKMILNEGSKIGYTAETIVEILKKQQQNSK